MNKKIPTPLAILIILLVIAAIIGISLWLCPEEETVLPQDETVDWQTYSSLEANFTFKYPKDWEIIQDYGGVKSEQRTVILQKIEDNDPNNWIRINARQFQCGWGECVEIDNNIIGTYSEKSEILDVFFKLVSSFNSFADWQTYKNKEYGFEITLFDSWEGYSVLEGTRGGRTLDGEETEFEGPQIVIRHPEWTATQPWQDIPIMVFTKEEWGLIEENNLNVSAAPVGPFKLGENQEYIFASPPRWIGFTDNLGQDETREIIETFKAF